MTIRDFAVLLTVWFSIPNRIGLGAVPLGALFLPFYLRLRSIEWLVFVLCAVVVFSNVRSMSDLLTAMTLMIGITIFFSFLTESVRISQKVFGIVVGALVLDALLAWAISDSGQRSHSLITQEPSHAARIIFVVMIAMARSCDMTPKKLVSLAMLGVFYLVMNKSSSALLMYLIFLVVAFSSIQLKRSIYLAPFVFVLVIISSLFFASPDSRFVAHTKSITNALSGEQTSAELMNLGSRRLSQSIGGYASANLWGHGYSSDGETFLEHSYQAGVDLYDLSIEGTNVQGPSSYFSELVYKAGWLRAGFLLLLILIALFARLKNGLSWPLLAASVGQILFFSTTTISTPWILLALTPNKARK